MFNKTFHKYLKHSKNLTTFMFLRRNNSMNFINSMEHL